jgi:hypothetical protein
MFQTQHFSGDEDSQCDMDYGIISQISMHVTIFWGNTLPDDAGTKFLQNTDNPLPSPIHIVPLHRGPEQI